jgi:pimeloyl-ACP methyl ester carboxylesterase
MFFDTFAPTCRWQPQIQALNAAGYRTIAPDLPGLGQSDKPTDLSQYNFQTVVTPAMVAVLDALSVDKFSVVGHDFGSGLAWGVAFMCPDRVERLVVLSVGYMGE